MKPKTLYRLLLIACCSVVGCSAETNGKPPELKIDRTPLERGRAVLASYADVVEPVQKAVVSVYSTKIVRQRLELPPFFRQFYGDAPQERESKEEGLGSGVIVTPDGYILTNNHVVDGADELNVLLADGREFSAKIIGADPKTDVAVIKIEGEGLPVVTLTDSDQLRVGDIVFAVGNPLGVGQTVTMGIVSATGRTNLGLLENVGGYENFIQTDAAINQGNSGGALIDAQGRLVGINTAIISPSRGNIGIGFAIPANFAASVMHSLAETGTVQRGYLGVAAADITPEIAEALGLRKDARGVIVTNVPEGGPAAKAGLRRNDILTAIDNRELKSMQDLRLLVSQMAPGREVSVKYLRDGKARSASVVLGSLGESIAAGGDFLKGVTVERLTDEQRRRVGAADDIDGLVITAVAPDSPFSDRLAAGMVIVEINKQAVKDVAQARKLLEPGRNLLMVYARGFYRPIAILVQ